MPVSPRIDSNHRNRSARSDIDAAQLWRDFEFLCGLGGRMAGGAGDRAAAEYAAQTLDAIGAQVARVEIPFDAWHATRAELRAGDAQYPCRAFLRSASTPPEGLIAEVADVGRGAEADFAAARLEGRIALATHEYPFSAEHIHRRRKYNWAVERGAVGFLLVNPAGGLLSGSSGRARGAPGIPAAYIAGDTAQAVRSAGRVRLQIEGADRDAHAPNVIADLGAPRVVLSAHLDGHDLGQSALDNATGVAVALAVARALPRGSDVRVALFSAEEWALTGSAKWLAALAPEERARMGLNINLDTVAGDDTLTALTGGFDVMARITRRAATRSSIPVGIHEPLMENSDHANFARAGIPALRLIAGFGRPASNVRHILSAEDTIDKVQPAELTRAATVAAAMVIAALEEA